MKNKIFKFQISKPGAIQLFVPVGAEILSCKTQGRSAGIWMLVDPEAECEHRDFHAYETGQELPELPKNMERIFIDTVLLQNGDYVMHIFEIKKIVLVKGEGNKAVLQKNK